jgi:hypothetical protein
MDGDVRLALDRGRDGGGEAIAIDREGVASGDAGLVAAADDERVHQHHLLLEEADGIRRRGGAEGVRAHQLRQVRRRVRGRGFHRPHLVQVDGMPAPGEPERALAAGQAGADDLDLHRAQGAGRKGQGAGSPAPCALLPAP